MIEFINNNKSKHDIKTMCTVLGVARSTYYKSFDKTKSARELENEELKSAIKRIYKENKGIYGALRIHYITWYRRLQCIIEASSKTND